MMKRRPILLYVLYAFTLVSVVGFATYGRHPEWLAGQSPMAIQFYAMSFRFFALGQVVLAGIVMIAFLIRHVRWKWITAFVAIYAISLGSELLGTTYGVPFGAYSYSAALNPMWLDRVPVGIPLSWFYMAVPSFALAMWLLPEKGALHRIAFGSFILLAWDLALDPAMSSATKYWQWGEEGPYYGMPLLNLFGWYLTGLLLMGALALLRAESWISKLPIPWLSGFYAANILLGLGISLAAGLWLTLVFTAIALIGTAAAAAALGGRDMFLEAPEPGRLIVDG
jgi:putative membrane protein